MQIVLKKMVLVLLLATVAACSAKKTEVSHPDETQEAPQTGDSGLDQTQITPTSQQPTPTVGQKAYVFSDRLRLRSTPEIKDDNIAGILSQNDQVEIIDAEVKGKEKFVLVRVVETESNVAIGTTGFLSLDYLSTTKAPQAAPESQAPSKYFMIQNIATEKIRVYEKCNLNESGKTCSHRLILEADMVAGEADTKTRMGSYRITTWQKFYETAPYPAWYRPNYPDVPRVGIRRTAWLNDKYMPNGKGDARGAFGWYTAMVGPNAAGQWTHGTMGWGEDSLRFITFKSKPSAKVVDIFARIRSHGCSRVDNGTISFLHHILPVGTPIIKVYAKEAIAGDQQYEKSTGTWQYIMNKVGYGSKSGVGADRELVLAKQIPESEWIEQGSLKIKAYPDTFNGNVYKLKDGEFSGVFYVDSGRLLDYRHPTSLPVGGYSDETVPSYTATSSK